MRYAQIRDLDISNGKGIGIALFVQGCSFHCDGCFNKETWDYSGGFEFGEEEVETILELLNRPFIKRLSILGGEPLSSPNVDGVYSLIKTVKKKYSNIDIWLYTGYDFEEVMNMYPVEDSIATRNKRKRIITTSDVVIDGRYDKTKPANYMNPWIGSLNQRVIDVKSSLNAGLIIEL